VLVMARAIYAVAGRWGRPHHQLPPKVLEPGRRKLGVAHRVLDVAMAEVGLQRAGIVAGVGEGETAGVRSMWDAP
jgi:hypothetical protein